MNLITRFLQFDNQRRLPAQYLLFYSRTPNAWLDVGWEGDFGWDSDLSAWSIPRTVTDWTGTERDMFEILGVGIFFDTSGNSLVVSGAQILAWEGVNEYHILYHPMRGLAVYDPYAVTDTVISKADKFMRQPAYSDIPTVFFNGCDITGSTSFDSGVLGTNPGQWVPDYLGNLVNAGVDVPAMQGMRLATTIVDGAVLGPELLTNGSFDSGSTGWSVVGADATHIATFSGGTLRYQSDTTSPILTVQQASVLIIGKRYQFVLDIAAATGGIKISELTVPSGTGLKTIEGVVVGTGCIIARTTANTDYTINSISVKEVIPTWKDTKLDGTPILQSTLQPTRTFDAGFVTATPGPTFKRYIRANPATDMPGYLSEPARTNKCTCRKANPVDTTNIEKYGDAAAVLSVVDDTAALAAAGLSGVCTSGKVYDADNTLGTTDSWFSFNGYTGNTNTHSGSVFARLASGSLQILVGPSSSYSSYECGSTSSSAYTYMSGYFTPADTTRRLRITVKAGCRARFILPQLEEGAFSTSPICKLQDGSDPPAAITRDKTVLSSLTVGKIRSNNQAYRMTVVPRASGQNGVKLFSSYADGSNFTRIHANPSNTVFQCVIGGVTTTYAINNTVASNNIPLDIIAVKTSSLGMQLSIRTFSVGSWGSFLDGVVNSSAAAKSDMAIGSTYQLGSINGIEQFTGNISELETLDIPLGITDPLAWAKAQWGVV